MAGGRICGRIESKGWTHNGSRLFQEIRNRGYESGLTQVKKVVREWRTVRRHRSSWSVSVTKGIDHLDFRQELRRLWTDLRR